MLTSFEQDLVAAARGACDRAVELTRELVACDTTARRIGDEPRDEARLQHILASRLLGLGTHIVPGAEAQGPAEGGAGRAA